MPNNYDFSKLKNVKEKKVNPEGWVSPLTIEYGQGYHNDTLSYHWRIKGTKHTFVIPIIRMDYITGGEYEAHFEETLQGFREDYKEWAAKGWETEWMQAYREDFSRYISV